MPLIDKYFFFTLYADEIDEQLLKEMSVLFSENYGVWDETSEFRGKRVRLSPQRLHKEYLTKNSCIVMARTRASGMLVGYAVAIKKEYDGIGRFQKHWNLTVSKMQGIFEGRIICSRNYSRFNPKTCPKTSTIRLLSKWDTKLSDIVSQNVKA